MNNTTVKSTLLFPYHTRIMFSDYPMILEQISFVVTNEK